MAQLIRSAKSASDWTANELSSYNITITYQDVITFFGVPNPPHPIVNLNPPFLTVLGPGDAPDTNTAEILHYLHLAMTGLEHAVSNFARVFLQELGYQSTPDRVLFLRTGVPLPIMMRLWQEMLRRSRSMPG